MFVCSDTKALVITPDFDPYGITLLQCHGAFDPNVGLSKTKVGSAHAIAINQVITVRADEYDSSLWLAGDAEQRGQTRNPRPSESKHLNRSARRATAARGAIS